VRASYDCPAPLEVAVARISEFNAVLNAVLALTEATTTECELLKPGSIERIQCEGKLLALHQVIFFFLEIGRGDVTVRDAKRFSNRKSLTMSALSNRF
jgi:hypothetical protein